MQRRAFGFLFDPGWLGEETNGRGLGCRQTTADVRVLCTDPRLQNTRSHCQAKGRGLSCSYQATGASAEGGGRRHLLLVSGTAGGHSSVAPFSF